MADLRWNTAEVADLVGGTLEGGNISRIQKVVTDSRQDVEGGLYVALKGENFDGHSFLDDVAGAGAVGAIVEKPVSGLPMVQIVVQDTLAALHRLANVRRSNYAGALVAITGSSGKTTTRNLVASILAKRYLVHQPIRNYNNHIGVPLTLLELDEKHEAAVLELGCSDFGEIETLAKMANPHVGLVTNVGPAHLEKLGDLDGVALAKGELFASMKPDAIAIVNMDDPRVASMPVNARRRVTYGAKEKVDIRLISRTFNGEAGQNIVLDIKGEKIEATLPLLGVHNGTNALAAAAVATAMDVDPGDLVAGLASVQQEPGRLLLDKSSQGAVIIDDTYNANPASVRAAVSVLKEISTDGPSIGVLGDMLELGESGEAEHLAIGEWVAQASIDILITIGQKAKFIDEGASNAGMPDDKRHIATDHAAAVELASKFGIEGSTVLVKGSRGMQMEQIVSGLKGVGD